VPRDQSFARRLLCVAKAADEAAEPQTAAHGATNQRLFLGKPTAVRHTANCRRAATARRAGGTRTCQGGVASGKFAGDSAEKVCAENYRLFAWQNGKLEFIARGGKSTNEGGERNHRRHYLFAARRGEMVLLGGMARQIHAANNWLGGGGENDRRFNHPCF